MNDNFRILRKDARDGARARLEARQLPDWLGDFRRSAAHYQLSPELEVALNMALNVGAPLLVTGEPGTGKTQVGWYLGWYFEIPVFDYQVRSNATAEDLKYEFDAVAYLRSAQLGEEAERTRYLHPRALWQAYEAQTLAVVLIDEIDKAPRDFPNDLLQELDRHRFRHPFEDRDVAPKAGPPLVVVTSNAERRLPDAFLRRCIVHHIELTDKLVEAAVGAHFPALEKKLKDTAIRRFWALREVDQLSKRPATAELLVWLAVLSAQEVDEARLANAPLRELPGLSALIKDHTDRELLPGGAGRGGAFAVWVVGWRGVARRDPGAAGAIGGGGSVPIGDRAGSGVPALALAGAAGDCAF